MATTYLSAVTSEPNRDQDHHHHHGILVSAHGAGGVMNLVNVTSGSHMTPGINSLYSSSPRDSLSMHEMKYLPPQHQHSLHNGHHPLATHNPWVVGIPGHDPTVTGVCTLQPTLASTPLRISNKTSNLTVQVTFNRLCPDHTKQLQRLMLPWWQHHNTTPDI